MSKIINLEKELDRAKKSIKANNFDEARMIYENILTEYPQSKVAKKGLKSIASKSNPSNKKITQESFSMDEQNEMVALYEKGDILGALERSTVYLKKFPNHPFIYNFLGICYQSMGQEQNAINHFVKALELKSDYIEAYFNLGNILIAAGRTNEAKLAYEEALKRDPQNTTIHRTLSSIKTYSSDDPLLYIMEKISNTVDTDSDKINIHFALAKAYDDIDEVEKGFNSLRIANNLVKANHKYNINVHKSYVENIKKIFDKPHMILTKDDVLDDSKDMIFIVGMPRSGTTLVEQILASHSEVYPLGEQNFLAEDVEKYIRTKDYNIEYGDLETIHNTYMDKLNLFRTDKDIFTDKTPHNFLYLGFILAAFPNVKIINLNRDPMAVCWSIYKTYFHASGLSYSFDMDEIVEFYKLYSDLMEFWKEKFPNRIYDISYENLTVEQESETRELLEYCGLTWDENCLEFYNTKRIVDTASNMQVREKIYTGSSLAWKKYENYLGEMLDGLKKHNLI